MTLRWCVYLLKSVKTGKSYVGCTNNVKRRLRQHNGEISGGGKWTKTGRPWKLVAYTTSLSNNNRSEAQKLEHKIKKGRRVEGRLALLLAA